MTDLDLARRFVAFSVETGALQFGRFRTKSGRDSPYFFNAGTVNSGHKLWSLADFYCDAITESGVRFNMLYGPAYKGIPLVVATAIRFAAARKDYPYAFNRKECKDHGEKGMLVGAPLAGRVLIVDDVITAGLSVAESVDIICAHGAEPCGLVIALDRMEKGEDLNRSAVQQVADRYHIPVICVATIDDIIEFISKTVEFESYRPAIEAYRQQYGISPTP